MSVYLNCKESQVSTRDGDITYYKLISLWKPSELHSKFTSQYNLS